MEMENQKRFMLGNLVMHKNDGVCRIMNITDDLLCLKKCSDGFMLYSRYDEIEGIPLSDKFFLDNDYGITTPQKESYGRTVQSIISMDGIGPAVTKYTREDGFATYYEDEVEYCITGIIIRTVDDFQNIMNVCGCRRISDNIV